jgi:outer membrane protein TolC
VTGVRLHALPLLFGVLVVGVAPALAQTPLTLEDAIRRAQGETADARALASAIDEANARVQRAQSGFWPRVDVTETVQRGNQPVFVFSSLLSQRRSTAANFAIPALNHPDPVTNTRTAVALEQRIFDSGLTHLGVQAATLEREAASAGRDATRQDLAFRAAQAFVQVLQLEATARATDGAVAAAESVGLSLAALMLGMPATARRASSTSKVASFTPADQATTIGRGSPRRSGCRVFPSDTDLGRRAWSKAATACTTTH